jgi:hypothetical protein
MVADAGVNSWDAILPAGVSWTEHKLSFADATYFAARAAIPAPEHSDSLSSLPAVSAVESKLATFSEFKRHRKRSTMPKTANRSGKKHGISFGMPFVEEDKEDNHAMSEDSHVAV